MPGEKVRIEGLKKLNSAFRKAADEDSREFLKAANKESAQIVEGAANPLIARKTGRLAATLKSSGSVRGGVVQIGKAKVPWAGPYHFGWRKRNIKPHPVLITALDKRREVVAETYQKRIDELLEKISSG